MFGKEILISALRFIVQYEQMLCFILLFLPACSILRLCFQPKFAPLLKLREGGSMKSTGSFLSYQ
jgi:hypothetical protein